MDIFADEHMVEMNRRQGRGGGRRHSRLRSSSRPPTPSQPSSTTPPLSPATPPPASLPGQPSTSLERKNGLPEDQENQLNQSVQAANGSEANGKHPDSGLKEQQARDVATKLGVTDVTKANPAPFTSSALPDDKAGNAIPTTAPPTSNSGGGVGGSGAKTPLDKVQQLSRKRERTPSPTLTTGLPNSKRPAISGVSSGGVLEAPSKGALSGGRNNAKAPSPLPNARVMSSASKVLTEEIQKQQGQENARLKLQIFKEIRKPGKSE